MLYIVSANCMAYVEIGDLVERARESGDQVAECGECSTVAQAMEQLQKLINAADILDAENVHIISNNGAYFAAAVITGAKFTWALDIY